MLQYTYRYQARIIEQKKIPCAVGGVSTVDDEEIYFNCAGFKSVDDPSSGEINKDSIFWICSQTKLITNVRPKTSYLRTTISLNLFYLLLYPQLAALQLIEKGKLQGDTPVSTYLPVFENPIILDDITKEKSSFKPATKAVRVQHLLNFSSGLFYPITNPIHVLPNAYTAPHQEEDPVGHFYNIIKVSLYSVRKFCILIYSCRETYLLSPSDLNLVATVRLLPTFNSPILTTDSL